MVIKFYFVNSIIDNDINLITYNGYFIIPIEIS
jgi:hypothetical protein